MTNKKEVKTTREVQDDGSIITSITTMHKEPIVKSEEEDVKPVMHYPVNRIILYSQKYLVQRFDNAGLCTINLTEEALKAGLSLPDKLKGRFVAIKDALDAIDHEEGKQRRQKQTIIFDAKTPFSSFDVQDQAYYNKYQ